MAGYQLNISSAILIPGNKTKILCVCVLGLFKAMLILDYSVSNLAGCGI